MKAGGAFQPEGAGPVRVVTLPVCSFAHDYAERPVDPARVGVTLLSVADRLDAKVQAIARARQLADQVDDRIELFNEVAMQLLVARATCAPHNPRERYFGPMADDTVRLALTEDGLRRLYEEVVTTDREHSPLSREAADDELTGLPEALAAAPPGVAARLRRVLAYVLDTLDESP